MAGREFEMSEGRVGNGICNLERKPGNAMNIHGRDLRAQGPVSAMPLSAFPFSDIQRMENNKSPEKMQKLVENSEKDLWTNASNT